MSLLREFRHRVGSIPILHRAYRAATGKSGPRWHLVIAFNARNKAWTCRSYPGYQSRNVSSLHLIANAMEEVRPKLTQSFKAVFWLGDMAPLWYFSGPHFAIAKSPEQHTTSLIPDYIFCAWPEAGITDYDATIQEMIEASRRPITRKGVFWIGASDKHPTRKVLLEKSLQDARIIARAVEWVGDNADAPNRLLDTKERNFVSLPDHCDFQYLIDLQGGGYSGRLKILLFSGRPLFVQKRRWEEYFFPRLEPFKHFIPVAEDLSDLSAMLDWADEQPAEAAQIALTAQQFARENLMRRHAEAEYQKLFLKLGGGGSPK